MHFFNPVYAMKLVEVIPGLDTAPNIVSESIIFSKRLGKTPIKVRECPGFVVNRLLIPYLNEALLVLEQGMTPAREIDEAMKAFGMPMGPLMLLDMIGIDIAERVSKILYEAYGPRMAVPSLLSELIADGRLGRKSGTGIYRYDGQTDENLPKIIQRIREKTGRSAGSFTPERILLPMINEAAICLQEDVASPDDLDLAMVLGTGFPQEKGGPLHHADRVGLDGVLADLDRHTSEVGIRFWPAPIIKRMAGAGHVGLKSRRGFFSY